MCFNTQPPEGGWFVVTLYQSQQKGFNTQPPEGGWGGGRVGNEIFVVSTHSRPKAAGMASREFVYFIEFQHTAARRRLGIYLSRTIPLNRFQHTAARRRLGLLILPVAKPLEFQHTAARRRLGSRAAPAPPPKMFQHTAARRRLGPTGSGKTTTLYGFNTQPPEGGWLLKLQLRI